jgi:short-subunit dehydrogenase
MKKVALITGASSGIGKEFAKIHAEKGGDVVIVARSEDKLKALKAELEANHNVKVTVVAKDLTDPKATQEIYDAVKAANIQVDYLINNAGFGGLGRFDQRDLQTDLNMIQLNISALTALTHHFLQDFVKRNEGKILNVSSTASLLPGPLQAVYYATKAYVTFFSNAVAEELSGTNVTVTNLMPGATATEFGAVSGMDKTDLFDKTASARSVAEDGYNAMLKGDLDIISGLTSSQKFMMKMLPFMSKKSILKRVHKMQTVS